MNSAMIQRQLKLNAKSLCLEYADIECLRSFRLSYYQEGQTEQGNVYTPFINKAKKRIKALEQLQKALKKDLNEAYFNEHHGKTWYPIEEESFLAGRARMAAEDGFVEPGVVAEIVEANR